MDDEHLKQLYSRQTGNYQNLEHWRARLLANDFSLKVVYENDPLPKVICHNCLHKLEVFHDFQRSCLKSEETLRNSASHSSQNYTGKSSYITQEPVYPAFRRSSQDFSDKPAPKNVPDFTAELHPVLPEQQTSADSEQQVEENAEARRQSVNSSEAPVEVVMVKQEPEEVKSLDAEEDTRWDSTNMTEEDNAMQTEHSMLQAEEDMKSELYGAMDSPIIRIERDFIVTKTNRGKRCLLRGQYKYRKARETRGGFIIWRCTNSNCSALLKTDVGCTTLFSSRNIHNHKEISWQKLAKNVFSKTCKCKRWGMTDDLTCLCLSPSSGNQSYDNDYYKDELRNHPAFRRLSLNSNREYFNFSNMRTHNSEYFKSDLFGIPGARPANSEYFKSELCDQLFSFQRSRPQNITVKPEIIELSDERTSLDNINLISDEVEIIPFTPRDRS
ncbi:hypothetical protein L9F63_016309 [Diploptera punctata]|uniref:ZAD domain-containing protein n=1 Tax=Diploptera punctata TaxID=6984 RepID=A0AAD8EHM7_DIPPU|nr:hypothetical protein L9F63_016309 [Diploptera punctata]